MQLKIKALSPKIGREIPAPFYASAGAAAMDLHACLDQAVTIPAGKRAVIPTGIAIALPSAEYVALVFARSGLGIKHGVAPANCVEAVRACGATVVSHAAEDAMADIVEILEKRYA